MSKKRKETRIVRRKKRKVRKRIYFILLPALILFIGVASYIGHLYVTAGSVLDDSYEKDERGKSELRDSEVNPDIDNVTVLIMGVDTSDVRGNEENARTDALMLASLNKDDKSVKLLSVPRDSYVYIPTVDRFDKINHAHAFGGTTGTIETVESLLDIPVDYYVKLNFEAFIDVVDSLGGIKAEVPYELKEQDSEDTAGAIHLMPGVQELNGEEALALARTRKQDNDIERGKRQQEIIEGVVDKTVSLQSIFKIDDVVKSVGDNMTTNMKFSEMKSFFSYITAGSDLKIETLSLEGTDDTSQGPYYWMIDEAALSQTKQTLQAHLDIEPTNNWNNSNATSDPETDQGYQN
ncbi:LCP family protein [Oceanobacillus kimchii]|uniref:LCP family protein n=1 Tax=Oceanobacillus kimchii TaxID=746691 RepID=UPI0021A633E9|nr:LCP family protein [Oceanobacillus kimchii]MCT1579233.1 LCP family protein [Oceanobacillus kimchii]MCT2134635.1 LCP family protein [Oceanobacillus kimchii]